MLMYTGTETVAMLADTSLTNKHLIQHYFWGKGFKSCDIEKNHFCEKLFINYLVFQELLAEIVGCIKSESCFIAGSI